MASVATSLKFSIALSLTIGDDILLDKTLSLGEPRRSGAIAIKVRVYRALA
jgi:hypothetical protein